jgi:hypothetical protein
MVAALLLALDDPPRGEGRFGAVGACGEVVDRSLRDDRILVLAEDVLERFRFLDEALRAAAPQATIGC